MRTKTSTKKAKLEAPAERDAREDREHEELMASLRQEQEARSAIVTATVSTVPAAELEPADDGPDAASAALVTHTLRTQGVRPVPSNLPGGTTCPECGQPLILAPRGGKQYVVCYSAIGEEGACWYHRELPAKTKEK